MSIWLLNRVAMVSTATKSISRWGLCVTSGVHTTVGVAVCTLASTWPGSRRLLSTAHSSCVVHRNLANWLGVYL